MCSANPSCHETNFWMLMKKQRKRFRDNFETAQKIYVCVANKPIMMPHQMNITILLQYYNYITTANQSGIDHSCHVDAQNTRMCVIKTIYPDVTSNERFTIPAYCQSILLAMSMLELGRWIKPKTNTNTTASNKFEPKSQE